MKFIAHRINTRLQLEDIEKDLGIEVDIRSIGQNLIVHHDPMEKGELFDYWLEAYNHSTLILNVKEEGLEPFLIEKMFKHGIDDYFFLDQSFPFLLRFSNAAKGRCAVRFSEFESIDTVISLKGRVRWVWVDCFNPDFFDFEALERIKSYGFKTCLVSPELHGRSQVAELEEMAAKVKKASLLVDAICTKNTPMWKALL